MNSRKNDAGATFVTSFEFECHKIAILYTGRTTVAEEGAGNVKINATQPLCGSAMKH